jgi:hypothetical protein
VALALLLARPALAELRVRASRNTPGCFEPISLTVTDPLGGLDARPGPLMVTMADAADHRMAVSLEPTGRPGEWAGRFTPVMAGRYTGTAVLERGDEKELGLVPLIRVQPSRAWGFVRTHPTSTRALRYSNGMSLFPIGVRLHKDDLRPGTNWRQELARLSAHGVNFMEVPVVWPGGLPEGQRREALETVDALVLAAERAGRMALQMRLEAPADVSGSGAAQYEEQLGRWARRWAYSPAVGVWYAAGARDLSPSSPAARCVQAIRNADPYRHLIAVPGTAGGARAGADLLVAPWNWQRPANQFALLEVPDEAGGPAPLPGENSWQMLALGGVGLPLGPYRVGAESPAFFQRMGWLARVAGSIPYQVNGAPLGGVVPVDSPGSFCRYGRVCVGWLAGETPRLSLPSLPRGRYEAHFWNPENDAYLKNTVVWSDGRKAEVELPRGVRSLFVKVQPAGDSSGEDPPSAAKPSPPAPPPTPVPDRSAGEAASRERARRVAEARERTRREGAGREQARQQAALRERARGQAAREREQRERAGREQARLRAEQREREQQAWAKRLEARRQARAEAARAYHLRASAARERPGGKRAEGRANRQKAKKLAWERHLRALVAKEEKRKQQAAWRHHLRALVNKEQAEKEARKPTRKRKGRR